MPKSGKYSSRVSMRFSKARESFLVSLSRDLSRTGIPARVHREGEELSFWSGESELRESQLMGLMQRERNRRLEQNSSFLSRIRPLIRENLASGLALEINHISPRIDVCRTQEDRDIFRFSFLSQSVPAPMLVFRRIALLVRDEGQTGSPVMGAIGLCSSGYAIGCRDRLLGWNTANGDDVKSKNLESCMQLRICMALPPYNYLRGARLMAALVFSDPVANEIFRRYGRPHQLVAVTTSSAVGLHSAMFNRIMLRPGGLYRRIGQTGGYSTLCFCPETLEMAKFLVSSMDGARPDLVRRPIWLLKRAMSLCKFPRVQRERFLKIAIPKGVYFGAADRNAIERLRKLPSAVGLKTFAVEEVLAYWTERDLKKATADAAKVRSVRQFDPARYLHTFSRYCNAES
jgi:hypothetical protein